MRQALAVKGVALLERRDGVEALGADQRVARQNVAFAIVTQGNAIHASACATACQRREDITAMSGGNVENAHRLAVAVQRVDALPQQTFDVLLAYANAAPSNGIEIEPIDQ